MKRLLFAAALLLASTAAHADVVLTISGGVCTGTFDNTGTLTITGCTIPAGSVTGLASSATTDTTNAANISSGTLPAARLPNPAASTLGGIKSLASATHQYLTSLSTAGVLSQAQPSSADISDLTAMAAGDVSNAVRTGTAPTIASCGTSPSLAANSTDYSGTVTAGSGTVTACTVTFAVTHTPRLRCWVEPSTAIGAGAVPTTTALVASFASTIASSSFDYGCQ